jgi:hypothetical protein
MTRWSRKTWVLVFGATFLAFLVVIVAGLYWALTSGATRPIDNKFGDQNLKTTVALVELHRLRYGSYPPTLSSLRFTGDWDAIALGSVSYCAAEDRQSYFVEVRRGWVGKPDLTPPPEFWQGTGFRPTVGPCR